MERLLVTGASGYIGQHLVGALLGAGVAVRGFAGRPQPAHLAGSEWVQGDIREYADVLPAVRGCTAVLHLACLPMAASRTDPHGALAVNVTGTLQILEAARAVGVGQVVYTSTAQVYGSGADLPLCEEAPLRPGEPYAASKLCGEVLCTTFARCYRLPVTVLRLFNVYGAALDGQPRTTVEAIFARRVAGGQPPVIKNGPGEGRDFVHVADVVRALQLAAAGRGAGEVINVGSGVLTTLADLAALVVRLAGSDRAPVVDGAGAAGPQMQLQADTTKAARLLGFQARVPLAAGLQELIAQERQRIGGG